MTQDQLKAYNDKQVTATVKLGSETLKLSGTILFEPSTNEFYFSNNGRGYYTTEVTGIKHGWN